MLGTRDDDIVDELLERFPGFRSGLGHRTGFSGWLLVFVLAQLLLLAGGVYRVGEICITAAALARPTSLHPSLLALAGEAVSVAIASCGTAYGVWLYAKLDVRARRYWLSFLPLSTLLVLIARFFGVHRYDLAMGIGRYELSTFLAQPRTWAAIGQPVVWTLYWLRSKRVRATFRRTTSTR